MNGYEQMAESYRRVMERDRSMMDEEAIKNLEDKARVFDVLSQFQGDDKYTAFDSSMFNDIFKGYIELIIAQLKEKYKNDTDEQKTKALELLESDLKGMSLAILDRFSAKDAEEQYLG